MDAPRRIPRRNKGFDETHQELIETAVRMISERGTDALSITALAREMGINRTTVYYHFDSREALLHAVSSWATTQPDATTARTAANAALSRPKYWSAWSVRRRSPNV